MLYVWTDKCKKDARIRESSEMQFRVGVTLAALGLDGLTPKSLQGALQRLAFYGKVFDIPADELQIYCTEFEESVGVRVNALSEPWAKWVKRTADSFVREKANNPGA